MIITNISGTNLPIPLLLPMQINQTITLTPALVYPINLQIYNTNLATLSAMVSANQITITGNDTNSSYTGPFTVTLLAGQSLDITTGTYLGYRIKIGSVTVAGAGSLFQARAFGNTAGAVSDYSTTGIYTGATAQCLPTSQGVITGNWDKVFVSSSSAFPIICSIVGI